MSLEKNVLVTGGAGYVGSHCCLALKEAGFHPITVDNLSRGFEKAVLFGPFEKADIQDKEKMREIINKYQPIGVIHCAAFAYVGESTKNPLLYYQNNVAATVALLSVLEEFQINNFIFSSTCATYGVPEKVPIDETEKQAPINPYGQSKLMIENVLKDLCQHKGFHAVALRYFNACGADPKGRIGENHDPETHLIPLVVRATLNPEKNSLTVFGNDYDTPDGTCIRDYIHVCDLAKAHVLALQGLLSQKSTGFEFYNLGSETGLSVLEIIQGVEALTDKKLSYLHGERREGDPPRLVASAKKFQEQFNWTPEFSKKKSYSNMLSTGNNKINILFDLMRECSH